MARAPITWKNVNQPNFGASNSLLLGASKQMSDAFSGLSDRFIQQGEYNKERNTDEAVAAASALDNLSTFGSDRQDAMQMLLGKNIDQTAVAAAYDNRKRFLQDNISFAQGNQMHGLDLGAKQFEAEHRGANQDLRVRKGESDIASVALNRIINAQEEKRAAYAATPEAIKAANDAAVKLAGAKERAKNAFSGSSLSLQDLESEVNSGIWGTLMGWNPLADSAFENRQEVAGVLAGYQGISKTAQLNAIRRSSNHQQIPNLTKLRKELDVEQARAAINSGVMPTSTTP